MKASSNFKFRATSLIESEFERAAKKWGIRIYQMAIELDHIHVLIRIPTRRAYRFFIQRVSGAIALRLKIKWLLRPYTRVVTWGREFKRVCHYIEMNVLEALGFIPKQPRGKGSLKKRRDAG